MMLSKGELELLKGVANGNKDVKNVALALQKSNAQMYRTGHKLIKKRLIELCDRRYVLVKSTIASLLAQLLVDFPSLIEPFSDSGIELLIILLEPKTIERIIREAQMSRTQVFKKIKQARSISLVKKVKGNYILNEKLWAKAIDFLKEVERYETLNDARIPAGSMIYYKNEKEIVFSTKDTVNAILTAFSAYEEYGIKILTLKNYYYLPKKRLSKREIFMHSLYVTEKEDEPKYIMFIALFYCKHKKEMRKIKHSILDNLKSVFDGKHIPGYPTITEIQERADMYDIKV